MTLPIDFNTSLWLTWTPVWEWEAVPLPAADAPAAGAAEGGADTVDSTGTAEERRLVFKGFEVSGSLHWFHADSPLSRPWIAARAEDGPSRRERAEKGIVDAGDAAATPASAVPTRLAGSSDAAT